MVVAKLSGAALVAAIMCLSNCAVSAEAAPSLVAAVDSQTQTSSATQATTTQTATQATPISARDQSLIDSVEKAYQAGITNYRDGHIAAAKSNFDYAVDLMLRSGIDLKNDAALSGEFDHIVDAINTLELDALRDNNPLTAQQHPEETAVDIANDVTFPADPKVRAQAEEELKTTQSDLPLVMND